MPAHSRRVRLPLALVAELILKEGRLAPALRTPHAVPAPLEPL